MEILAAIAGKLAEFTVAPIGRQVGYLAHHKSNHQNLQTKLEDLSAARDEVQHKVDQFRRGGKRIETTVLNWKTRVDAIITESEEFLRDGRHAQTECLHGFCPHLVLRYQLSRKSAKLVEKINELYGKKEFSNFAYDVLPQDLCLLSTRHYSTFDSRNSVVLRVMDELRNPNTEMILVWGIGGVGKTTLVEEVLRQAKDVNLFDDLVMVRAVKEYSDLEKIQKEIAMKLGMSIDKDQTLAERALLLGHRIIQKRTLVVLDDVWEEIDLLAVGVPCLVNLKVLLTCRSRKELSLDMRTQKDILVDVLNEEEAWSLFDKMAGDVVKDSRIQSIAIEVAKNCGGLPVLIVTVARALKDRNNIRAWRDTLRRLGGFDNKEFTEKAYLALEWSYDQLEDKELKPLFLLCGIIAVKNHIYLADLLKYSFVLGLIKNVYTIEEARDALDPLVEKLKDSCLLRDSDINMHVRMHDLVCEVAIRIASRDQHVLSIGYGSELKEWPDKDFFERCSKMSLKSSNIPMLSEVPWKCPKLEMFYLYKEQLSAAPLEFPSNFFSEMEKLKVLGLTEAYMVSLPPSLQLLKNLQTLCLKDCWLHEVALLGHLSNLEILSFARSNIKRLPKEIGHLIRLRWLDLSDCAKLKVISPGVISRLERLEDLSLRNVFLKWEAERGGSNASLLELKDLTQLTALEIYIEDANILPSNLFSRKLVRYQIYIGDVWERHNEKKKSMAETTLNTLKLKLAPSNELDHGIKTLLKRSEDVILDGSKSVNTIIDVEDFQQLIHLRLQNNVDFTYISNRKVVFPNLTTLSIWNCDHLRFLFSFSTAQSLVELKHLEVSGCAIMEAIISTRYQPNGDIVFRKLESLTLKQLPNLHRFCTESCSKLSPSIFDPTSSKKLDVENGKVVFPNLTTLSIWNCDHLSFLFSFSMAQSLVDLKHLEVSGCAIMEAIISTRDQPNGENIDIVFRKLESLTLKQLPNLDRFCTESCTEFSSVMKFDAELGASIFDPTSSKKLDVENGTAIRACLFDPQVKFPSLERLKIDGLGKLHTLWNNKFADQDSFCQLKEVEVSNCNSLKKIFPVSVARRLQKLHSLDVEECDEVEEIITGEQGLETESPHLVFPKVTRVGFLYLPKLSRFYPGIIASKWPLLKQLYIVGCGKVKMFAAELPISSERHEPKPLIEQSLFLIDKDSFPNLEYLTLQVAGEIWYGPSSSPAAQFFPKLKTICFRNWAPFFVHFLAKLPNLEQIRVIWDDVSTELFVNEEINGGEEIHAVKTLRVFHMPNLLQLGNGNSQTAGPLFPNLVTLYVYYCNMLKSVESSAISFRNLTTLEVFRCEGLEYLTSYSVAKSLMQLTRLDVWNCESLRAIIGASNEDDHDTGATCEIAFTRLQHLSLHWLSRLQGFCSGNCIVRLPSSTELHVNDCGIELKISSEGVLLSNRNPERVQIAKPEIAEEVDDNGDGEKEKDEDVGTRYICQYNQLTLSALPSRQDIEGDVLGRRKRKR